jgi:hypothetical protein
MCPYQKGALVSFWVISTLVHMGHGALVLITQCGPLVHWDQSGAPKYFGIVDTVMHIGIEASMDLSNVEH